MVYRASAGGGSGSGSGTVNSGTANQVAFYSTTGTAVSGSTAASLIGGTLTVDAANTSAGIGFQTINATGGAGQWCQLDGAAGGTYNLIIGSNGLGMNIPANWKITWSANDGGSGQVFNNIDTSIQRVSVGVLGVGTGTALSRAGYINWGGEARVTADVSFVSTATLANVTGLSVPVTAARTYAFQCVLYTTANVAGGIKAAAFATAAATFVRYEGYSMHVNTLLGQTRATSVGTAVAATTTAIAATVFICGTITPSATGNFTIQAAQNATVASATVVLAGSYLLVDDVP